MNIEDVKQIPIADYLHSLGYSPVKQQGNGLWYKSPLREEHEPSFKVNTDRNLWYDFGAGKGGNLIALAKELYCSDSLPYLLNRIAEQRPHVRPVSFSFPQRRTEPSFQHLEVRDLTHPALLRYLQGRGINIELAKENARNSILPITADRSSLSVSRTWQEVMKCATLFQRLHRPERHHPHTAAGRAEGEMFGVRGFHGLPLFPYAPHEELSGHARP